MDNIDRIRELTAELLQRCHEYYDLDAPTISDAEYDRLFDVLKDLEDKTGFWLANSPTRQVQGQVLDGFSKVAHSKPMLSAAKTKSVDDIKKFIGDNDFYCSYKLDGLTLVVIYENGKFKQAITRGTGLVGEDVTEQAKMISNLPMSIEYQKRLELRGECVISWEQFNKINATLEKPYSHPRNLAAGSLRQLDTNTTKGRGLSYVVFECVSDLCDDNGNVLNDKSGEIAHISKLGFDVVSLCIADVDGCVEFMKPELYNYPVDGLIFELNDKQYSKSLVSTGHHEGCRMALKWKDDTYETTLRDIEWNTTRSGLIAPVAVFDEIDLDGALTTRATLHNVSIIESLELGIGDAITVYRSNMVIPKIDDNLTRSNTYKIPNKCPCCGLYAMVVETDNSKVLMCTNQDCSAKKIAQFTHFVSRDCMNIDGLSAKTLELLISNKFLNTYKDIYKLKEHSNELICLDGLGDKSVANMLQSIEDSRKVTLDHFVCALGIPMIGSTASKAIAQDCFGDYNIFTQKVQQKYDWGLIDGFGEIMCQNLNEYFYSHFDDVDKLAYEMDFIIPVQNITRDSAFAGKNVCVTGKLLSFTRDSINEKITSLGAKAVNSVSKTTDYLITNEASGSSKYKKAIELSIPIITEQEFLSMIGE